jgi:hypothetical protein
MIILDYAIRKAPSSNVDLRTASESDLHYDLFLGDVTFKVDDTDLSALWGWIPIIDFAACLHRIADHLVPGDTETFEFTESEQRLDFTLQNGIVEINSTYANATVTMPRDELRRSAREFLKRVLDDLSRAHPGLDENSTVRRLYPKSLVTTGGDAM